MSFDFFPNEQTATLLNAARHPSDTPDPGTFTNFLPGAASYGMRSLAEVGRAVDMAGAVFPIAVDAITGGTERQDQYFREHDEVFNNAVEHWTPKPGEVGTAGQVAGQLAGGVLQATISPALLVATSQLATGEDLVRQGVDATTANEVGAVGGAGSAIGIKLPFLGRTLASRVASGVVGNVAQGAGVAGAQHAILDAAGNEQQAQQFDPTDLRGRLIDAMLGAAFGGLAHVETKLTPVDEAALLVTNQARHLEETTSPGEPRTANDLTQHVDAMREAVGQLLRGDPVAVDKTIEGMGMDESPRAVQDRAELADELTRLAAEEVPPAQPIEPEAGDVPIRATEPANAEPTDTGGPGAEATPAEAVPTDAVTARAQAALERNPDMLMPTSDTEAPPERAADVLQRLGDERADAQAHAADLFRTAAACLLGVL